MSFSNIYCLNVNLKSNTHISNTAIDDDGKIYFSLENVNIIYIYYNDHIEEVMLPDKEHSCSIKCIAHIKNNKMFVVTGKLNIMQNEYILNDFYYVLDDKKIIKYNFDLITNKISYCNIYINDKIYIVKHTIIKYNNSQYTSYDDNYNNSKDYIVYYLDDNDYKFKPCDNFQINNGRYYSIGCGADNNMFYYLNTINNNIEIRQNRKVIKTIAIKDQFNELICNYCMKNNIIYFIIYDKEYKVEDELYNIRRKLHVISNNIIKCQDDECTKIKIFDVPRRCASMIVGLHDEIYFISYIGTDYEFGVFDTSYRKICSLNSSATLDINKNGEIIVAGIPEISFFIYKPDYVN